MTSSVKYDGSQKHLQRFVNAIDIVPDDNEKSLSKKHFVGIEIFKDDTYKITFDGEEDKEPKSIFEDFELSGPKEILDTSV